MPSTDDLKFSSFTRDLARRQRRPRAYARTPAAPDALELLCGGGKVPSGTFSAAALEDAPSDASLPDSSGDLPS